MIMKEFITAFSVVGVFIFLGVVIGANIRDYIYEGLLDKKLYEIKSDKTACELNIPRTQVCKPTIIWTPTQGDFK